MKKLWLVIRYNVDDYYSLNATYETELEAREAAQGLAKLYDTTTYCVAQIVSHYNFKPAQVVRTDIVTLKTDEMLDWTEKIDETT